MTLSISAVQQLDKLKCCIFFNKKQWNEILHSTVFFIIFRSFFPDMP